MSCLLAGFGPFEMIDMCNALDIEPVITTTESSSPQSLASLVEYCYGGIETLMGAKRHADGHPQPYRAKYFELGNEEYNARFVEQAAAMEAKARELGIGNTIHYINPAGGKFLNATDLAKAEALNMDHLLVAGKK